MVAAQKRIVRVRLLDREQAATTVKTSKEPSVGERLFKAALIIGGVVVTAYVVGEIFDHLTLTAEERSIRDAADRLCDSGWDVQADHIPGYDTPPILNGRRPDVYARKGGRVLVQEHETTESVSRSHSREQDRDLRTWAARRPYARYEQVVVEA